MSENKKICEYCGKEGHYSSKYSKILCGKHYRQLQDFGCIKNTKYDANEINEYDKTIGIITRDSKYNITGEFIIDKEDYEKIKHIRWRNHKGYAINNSKCNDENLYLHRIIAETPNDMVCDHIDRNTYNCTKNNLRNITQHENCFNRQKGINQVDGVTRYKDKWRVRIMINQREHDLGTFNCYIDGVKKRIQAESMYYGELSPHFNPANNNLTAFVCDEDTNQSYIVTCNLPKIIYDVKIEVVDYEEIQNV